MLTKIPSQFHDLLEELACSNDQCPVEKRLMKAGAATVNATIFGGDMEGMNDMLAQMMDLKKQFQEMKATPEPCFWCNGPHFTNDCPQVNDVLPENANYMGNYKNRSPFQNVNNYNNGARNNQ